MKTKFLIVKDTVTLTSYGLKKGDRVCGFLKPTSSFAWVETPRGQPIPLMKSEYKKLKKIPKEIRWKS